jgi:hypothetical protein
VPSTARDIILRRIVDRARQGAELVYVPNQLRVVEYFGQLSGPNAEMEKRSITVHPRSNRGVCCHLNPEVSGQGFDACIVVNVRAHQNVADHNINTARLKEPDSRHRALQRSRQLGDRVMNLSTMGVNAYADLLDPQIAHAVRFFLADHEAVCLYFYAELPPARMLQDLEEIHAHEHFAAAQRKK